MDWNSLRELSPLRLRRGDPALVIRYRRFLGTADPGEAEQRLRGIFEILDREVLCPEVGRRLGVSWPPERLDTQRKEEAKLVHEVASDLVRRGLWEGWQHPASQPVTTCLEGWAAGKVRDAFSRRIRRKQAEVGPEPAPGMMDAISSGEPGLDHIAESRETLRRYWAAFRSLPITQRRCWGLADDSLHDVQHYGIASLSEIARGMELNEKALAEVWNRLEWDDERISKFLNEPCNLDPVPNRIRSQNPNQIRVARFHARKSLQQRLGGWLLFGRD